MNFKKIFRFDPFSKMVKSSAGVIIILGGEKVLLCHPTNGDWNSLSFPKGGLNKDEECIDAAIRELREETSIIIDKEMIKNPNDPILVEYKNKKGYKYKKVFLYLVYINDVLQIGLSSEVIPKENLQLEEVDWCGFLTKEEAKSKIFHRMLHLLDLI